MGIWKNPKRKRKGEKHICSRVCHHVLVTNIFKYSDNVTRIINEIVHLKQGLVNCKTVSVPKRVTDSDSDNNFLTALNNSHFQKYGGDWKKILKVKFDFCLNFLIKGIYRKLFRFLKMQLKKSFFINNWLYIRICQLFKWKHWLFGENSFLASTASAIQKYFMKYDRATYAYGTVLWS